jgi:AcrR family transcriptional regulator
MRTIDPQAHAATRCRILDAARGLFAAKGYSTASMNDVARQAGLAKAAVYHYFQGKHALLESLHEDLWAEPAAALASAPRPKDLRAALAYTGAQYIEHFQQPRNNELMRIAFNVSVLEPELLRQAAGDLGPKLNNLLLDYFRPVFPKGVKDGAILLHLMPYFGALFHFLFVLSPTCPTDQLPGGPDQYLAHLVDVFSTLPKRKTRLKGKP